MIEILPNWHPILAFRIPYGCTLYSNEQIHRGGKRYDSVGLLESYIGIENKRVVGVF